MALPVMPLVALQGNAPSYAQLHAIGQGAQRLGLAQQQMGLQRESLGMRREELGFERQRLLAAQQASRQEKIMGDVASLAVLPKEQRARMYPSIRAKYEASDPELARELPLEYTDEADNFVNMTAARMGIKVPEQRAPTTRTVNIGGQEVTQEWRDGNWTEVGRGDRWNPKSAEGQETFGNNPIWATDAQGNPVLLQPSNRGGARPIDMPPGVTPQRGQIKYIDLGDRFGVIDANGMLIGYQAKGTGPQVKVDEKSGTVTTVPGQPAASLPTEPSRVDLPQTPREREAAERRQAADVEQKVSKADTVLDSIKNIEAIMDANEKSPLAPPPTGTLSRVSSWMSGSDAGKVRSYVAALQSGVALDTMMKLKEASATGATGFGQLNRAELQIMLDTAGSLDPDNTSPEVFRETLRRLRGRYNRVLDDVMRNVSPERMRELGLDKLVARSRYEGMSDDELLRKLGIR